MFYYTLPNDTVRRYKITEHTDSTLVFKEKERFIINFTRTMTAQREVLLTPAKNKKSSEIIPSQGDYFYQCLERCSRDVFLVVYFFFYLVVTGKRLTGKLLELG